MEVREELHLRGTRLLVFSASWQEQGSGSGRMRRSHGRSDQSQGRKKTERQEAVPSGSLARDVGRKERRCVRGAEGSGKPSIPLVETGTEKFRIWREG